MKIAFIGLGNMGLPMALGIAGAGHELTVFNRTPERAEPLREAGARVATSPADAARNAEVVVTMLADDRALDDVVFGAGDVRPGDGLVDALEPGATHVSMSTVGVAAVRRIAGVHAAHGNGFVSAPVFGRPEAAASAKLWVVAAGRDEAVAFVRPVLDAVGQGVFVVGDEPSSANAVKLGGNFLIAAMMEALGEAFAFGRKQGIEPAHFLEIVNTALFKSPLYQNYGTIIAERRYEPPGFRLRLGLKDIRLVLEAAGAAEAPMPLASLLRDNFLGAVARGEGDRDWAALASVAARDAGLDS